MAERAPHGPDHSRVPVHDSRGGASADAGRRGEMTEGTSNPRTDDPSAWLIVRRDGIVMTAERRACELLGAPDPDALAGREWSTLVAAPGTPEARAAGRAVATGGTWEGTLPFRYGHREVALAATVAPVASSSELMVMGLRPAPPRSHPREAFPPRDRIEPPASPALSRDAEGLRALVSAYDALYDLDEPAAIARSVLQALESAMGFDWAAVLRYTSDAAGEPAGVEVVTTYPTPMAGVARGARWSPPEADEALVRTSGEPSMQGELRSDAGSTSPLRRLPAFGMHSRILIPLYAETEVVGALALFRAAPLAFTAAEGILAERTVRRLGEALGPEAPIIPLPLRRPPEEGPRYVPPLPVRAIRPSEPEPSEPPAPSPPPPPTGTDEAFAGSRLESLGQLVAGVAHELNNPLTSILGYAQILGGLAGTERDHALRTIEDEAQRAARIVRNLLSFARQRPGQRRLVNIEEMLRRIVDLRRYALEMDNVRVVTRLGLVPDVLIDEGQFEQVFLNLLNNAHQALQSEGWHAGEVTITTWHDAHHVYVSFEDNGPGVPEELRPRIFEPFFTTREVGSGQGMGLAIVYGVVSHHGGRAWVEGNALGGATFVIELPRPETTPSPTPAEDAPAPTDALAPLASATRPRILVVDDEASVRALTREILGATGYDVATAEGGQEALRLLGGGTFDLVITDLRMPGMDGASLYRQMLERWPDLAGRILFVTGDIEGEPSGRLLDAAAVRYLEKPFTTQQLVTAVQEILGEAEAP